jgi:hypothetical protein
MKKGDKGNFLDSSFSENSFVENEDSSDIEFNLGLNTMLQSDDEGLSLGL